MQMFQNLHGDFFDKLLFKFSLFYMFTLYIFYYRISAIDFKCNERDDNVLARLKLNALPTSSSQPISSKKADSQSTNKSKVS